MSSLFVCPLCSEKLTRRENSYFCPNGHCHDVAREGYTYLLPAVPFSPRITIPLCATRYVNFPSP